MKKCTKCGVEKAESEFGKTRFGTLRSWCNRCKADDIKRLRDSRRNPDIPKRGEKIRGDKAWCTSCGAWLPLADFGRCAGSPGGLYTWCKPCVAKSQKERRLRNPAAKSAANKRYRDRARARKYREHPELVEKQRRRAEAKREKFALDHTCTGDNHILCPRCGETKLSSEFCAGRIPYCRSCWKVYCREYRETHSEFYGSIKARAAEWREQHPERVRELTRRWRREHPEQCAWAHRQREAQKRGGGTYSREEWLALLKSHEGKCAKCGATEDITADHIVPLALGGSNTIDNIQPLCRSCNSRKGATVGDFRRLGVVG
jgi:5-methylcytosine-specific restriction endonuclease McrA